MKTTEKKRKAGCMEYVIVAILILAAIAVGLWFFGRDLMNMFGTAGNAASGDNAAARECQKSAQTAAEAGHEAGAKAWKAKNVESSCRSCNSDDEGRGCGNRGRPRDSTVNPVPIPDDGGSLPSDEFKE